MMADFLAWGQDWLATVRSQKLRTGRTLTYQRSGESDIDLTDDGVVIGTVDETLGLAQGVTIDVVLREYIIPKSAINFGSGAVEPTEGDKIVEVDDDGNTNTYEAASFGGLPAARDHDPEGNAWRIRMQQVSVA